MSLLCLCTWYNVEVQHVKVEAACMPCVMLYIMYMYVQMHVCSSVLLAVLHDIAKAVHTLGSVAVTAALPE